MDSRLKILIGSPIRQKYVVLKEFISGIEKLNTDGLSQVDYCFIDDNVEAESRQLLAHFKESNPNLTLIKSHNDVKANYLCDDITHVWEEDLIWKVAKYKNLIIEKALQDNYDFLFLVDSDLVLHPQTLVHLVSLEKDIISEVFWTRWEPDFPELPQVWLTDQYNLYQGKRGQNLTQEEIIRRVQAFINQLRVPGVYPVGGLGACTLISRKALQAGVNYNEVCNITLVGEDRHFCIRAAALGFELFVDTHYPAYHIYRLSDLEGLEKHTENW